MSEHEQQDQPGDQILDTNIDPEILQYTADPGSTGVAGARSPLRPNLVSLQPLAFGLEPPLTASIL
jgi:hypothetical protein